MVISVDLDGVVYNFCREFAGFLCLRYGKSSDSMPVPTTWNFAGEWGLSEREFFARFREFGEVGGFAHGEPLPGAVAALHKLEAIGHRIRIVTARGCELLSGPVFARVVKQATVDWLYKANIPYSDLYFTSAKADVVADVFIDDAPHNLEAIRTAGKRAVAFDAPYNRQWNGERIQNWGEFFRLITGKEI